MKTVENKIEILRAFDTYQKIVFTPDTDLSFWKSFVETSIKDYKIKNPNQLQLYSAGFSVYDCSATSDYGSLKSHKKGRSISVNNLEENSEDFFSWISSLVILKTYNATEIFIFKAIQIRYYPSLNFTGSRKSISELNNEICSYLKAESIIMNKKNNRHIFQFLTAKSTTTSSFLNHPIRTDLTTNWSSFFELVSILRNVIAHHGTIITKDVLNQINTIGKDVFERYFTLTKEENNDMNLRPNIEQFSGFLSHFNELSLNIVKFIFEEEDFKFFEMY